MAGPARYLSSRDRASFVPVHAVWEITLACDLKCHHCGSRAGKRRPDELTTDECLDLVRQLARMGTREVTLIGGEAYLRRDWLKIIREIRDQGMDCLKLESSQRSMQGCKHSAFPSTDCAKFTTSCEE
jgi:MoaA/NifB/PqqE/SkfB family radical SAM enzyme